MKTLRSCLFLSVAALAFAGSGISQSTLQIGVYDAQTGAPIPNASVAETTSAQTILVSASGFGEFPIDFVSGSRVELEIRASGYPVQYREFDLNSGPHGATDFFAVNLYSANQFRTPPMGAKGGLRSYTHRTGQVYSDNDGNPTGEYLQQLSAQFPVGALTSTVKVGLTLIPPISWNVLHAERDLPASWRVGAQCQLSVFDLAEEQIVSPPLAAPVRIEMDPGYYFDAGHLKQWSVAAYHFDQASQKWTTAGIADSGKTPEGKLWVDLMVLDNFTFMLVPNPPAKVGGGLSQESYWTEVVSKIFTCNDGAPFHCAPTDFPNGTQGTFSVDVENFLYDQQISPDFAVSLGNALTKNVVQVVGSQEGVTQLRLRTSRKKTLPSNSFRSFHGTVCLRANGRAMERTQMWWDVQTNQYLSGETKSFYILTGTQICKIPAESDS